MAVCNDVQNMDALYNEKNAMQCDSRQRNEGVATNSRQEIAALRCSAGYEMKMSED